MIDFKKFVLLESLLKGMTNEEVKSYRKLKKVFKEFQEYKHKSRNMASTYAKRKFSEAYNKWMESVRSSQKQYGKDRGKYLIDAVVYPLHKTK